MKPLETKRVLSVTKGLCAVVMLWIAAGVSIPLIKRYDQFRPEMLLIVRGSAIAIACFLCRKFAREKTDKYVILAGLLFTVSSITFFQAVNVWAPNPVIIVVTLTPLVNFAIALRQRTKIPVMAYISLLCIIVGEWWALDLSKQSLNVYGFILSIFTALTAGLGLDCWSKTSNKLIGRMRWYAAFLIPCALLVLLGTPGKIELIPPGVTLREALYVFSVIGTVGGVAYIYCASVTTQHLPITSASILLQGETPAVIVGTWFFMKHTISLSQGFGVAVMLFGISVLVVWLASNSKKSTTPSG